MFLPRLATAVALAEPVVWGIDEPHLVNYLLPRNCPRVTFAQAEHTSEADRSRFFPANACRVVAIEAEWLVRALDVVLYVYEFAPEAFKLRDDSAGYWVSRESVKPLARREVRSVPVEIVGRRAEFRVVESLWPLHDAVSQSTLEFSMIRMRNARKQLVEINNCVHIQGS